VNSKKTSKSKYNLLYAQITDKTVNLFNRKILRFGIYEHNKILELINSSKKDVVVDYGCNTGYLSEMILDKYHSKVISADINKDALLICKEKNLKTELINKAFFKKYNSKIDIVLCSHVLEHTKKPDLVLNKLFNLLKKNGKLVLVVPQERIRGDINPVQTLLFWLQFKFENPHLHNFKWLQLSKMLKNLKFKINSHCFVNFIPPFITKERRFLARSLIISAKKI
jgi:2-polyprenyl-3-methyl-5-hydroxy-6-metoxy-1,4-benzoquinol methylase